MQLSVDSMNRSGFFQHFLSNDGKIFQNGRSLCIISCPSQCWNMGDSDPKITRINSYRLITLNNMFHQIQYDRCMSDVDQCGRYAIKHEVQRLNIDLNTIFSVKIIFDVLIHVKNHSLDRGIRSLSVCARAISLGAGTKRNTPTLTPKLRDTSTMWSKMILFPSISTGTGSTPAA